VKRVWGILGMLSAGVAGAVLGYGVHSYRTWKQGSTTLTSLSPNDAIRIHLVDLPGLIDRNLELKLESLEDHTVRTIFYSPDEGRPTGSERIIWSADGSRLLLVGRHFFLKERDLKLPSGDSLYLMYDVPSGRLWCNSEQQDKPPFSLADLRDFQWVEMRLPPRSERED
jgi:hypothetical protein